jgi:RND superfamily putative drug exporter
MIGLAVGIDYALFIVERFREERRTRRRQAGRDRAGRRHRHPGGRLLRLHRHRRPAGHARRPMSVFRSLGIGAALVVVVAMLASMTLIPALLSLLGDKIDWPRRKKYDAAMVAAQGSRTRRRSTPGSGAGSPGS